jgi:hypothetical protein
MKTSRFGQNEWLEICAMLFGDGVEDKMRYASCFVRVFSPRGVHCILCLRITCVHDPSLKPPCIREVICLDTFVYIYIPF